MKKLPTKLQWAIDKSNEWAELDFVRCYPVSEPAWIPLMERLVNEIASWNKINPACKVTIEEAKSKWGYLTIYLGYHNPNYRNPHNGIPDHIIELKNEICSQSIKICRICFGEKIETVIESRLTWRCLEHYNERNA
tara:strand:- start:107 stop:514 length:408 start_codon:yes stop_codon:yes gene_type:complete